MQSRATLRAAHDALLLELADAEAVFRKDARYSGRVGAAKALLAFQRFVQTTTETPDPAETQRGMQLLAPLAALLAGLGDLERGTVAPIIRPAKAGNSPPTDTLTLIVRAQIAIATECLVQAGMPLKEASAEIARRIHGKPYAAPKRSIENWRQDFQGPSADPECVGVQKFRRALEYVAEFKGRPAALRRYAQYVLADQVFAGWPASPQRRG
ncbi:hypothetical protein GXW71_28260 [Roseomonas hellenica]|uniref:Uncharacterized protein n=1 Tax=Plastoroseomonas hellenica TaxID=2687306 RepID=A0ABS5F6U5_9PROT|nr:hypothetical protein [Plastoroseomonas hellenica]MBR0668279.1 hypothetical protein [Plastoroseomonas hellenica]